MKISYVLPVRNGQNMIASCLKTLIKQVEPVELIVIDDASTDHTRDVIERYREDISKVIYNNERLGGAKCRNIGNKAATGDIIAVCDVDEYAVDRCTAIREAFESDPEAGIFCSGLTCRDAKNPYINWSQEAYNWDFNSKCTISHPTVAYKRELALKHPYHEDTIESDLFEFMLIDMHRAGAKLIGTQAHLMVKIEGDTIRDRTVSDEIKRKKYKEYGIEV